MSKTRLGALDRIFLGMESRESMMHVGALMPFALPRGKDASYLQEVVDRLRASVEVYPPWNLKLKHPGMLSHPRQAWVEDDRFDLDYHMRRSALASPGDERELGILVSRLHSHQMDFHHPLWELHLIEGLENNRFAMYVKIHHALVDGYTGAKILADSLAPSAAASRRMLPFFAKPLQSHGTRDRGDASLGGLFEMMKSQLSASLGAARAMATVARASRKRGSDLVAPLQAPRSILNQRISRNRRFATQQYALDRIKTLARTLDCTLNDVVLALSGASLRRLLLEQNALPEKPLIAMLPVNIRPKDDPGGGNAVGTILASIATDIADPLRRVEAIKASTARAKAQLQGMSQSAIIQYSAMLMAPLSLQQLTGTAGRTRPAFNLVISNVPGPQTPLYFHGCRLEAVYPLSIPFHGYGLNITIESYADTVNLGFIGCRDTLPHMQRLAVYSGLALEELERAAGTAATG